MELALLVYLISVLTKLVSTIGVLVVVLGTILPLLAVYTFAFLSEESYNSDSTNEKLKVSRDTSIKWLKRLTVSILVLLSLGVAIPSEKVAYTMVGAYAAQKVAENPEVQKLSGKVLKIVELKLDSYITDKK